MAEDQPPSKWEGKASAELKGCTEEQVWPLLADFCNLHKWLQPTLDTCYLVEGVPGVPGLIRYAAGPPTDPEDQTTILWTTEKLLLFDPVKHCLSYEIIDNNIGFASYVAIMQLVPVNDEDSGNGCKLEWSFVSDPVVGWKLEDLQAFINSSIQLMAKSMELALLSTSG